ncbi:Tn3 family transposase [uncultured Zhongshania sp.]|uniref:Tn3 family transposase n=1 Tax=uncultured Zhongshania sp. TaxID=1642288 RepID=UPI0025EE2F75|nr:Tn3 family transposase [uncultured Zhongshania sp.]
MPTEQHILSKARRQAFDSPPKLHINRNRGFVAVDAETRFVIRKMSTVNKVGFMLQKAYFHAKGRFYNAEQFKAKDIAIVVECLGLRGKVDIREYPYSTQKAHQKKILAQFNWEQFNLSHQDALERYAAVLAEKVPLKEDLLFKLVEWCWASRTAIPSYRKLSNIVISTYRDYERRLESTISNELPPEDQIQLLKVFCDEILTDNFSKLCKISQSRNLQDLSHNAKIFAQFKKWFEICQKARLSTEMSSESIRYFAEIVKSSTLPQLRKLTRNERQCLLAICFIFHQFHLRTDDSISAFIKDIRAVKLKSLKFEKETQVRLRKELSDDENVIIGSMENSTHTLRLIVTVGENNEVGLAERTEKMVQLARACLSGNGDELESSLDQLRNERTNLLTHKHQYDYIFEQAAAVTKKYNQYLPLWVFNRDKSDKNIMCAIDYLNSTNKFVASDCPTEFMDENDKKYVFRDNVNVPVITRYRSILFIHLEKCIRNKSVTLLHSYIHQDPNTTFISNQKWDNEKHSLCAKSGLLNFLDGEGSLKKLGHSVHDFFDRLHKGIESEENSFVRTHPRHAWFYDTPKTDFSTEKFISKLLNNDNVYISLLNVIREIDRYANFSDRFSNKRISGGKASISKKLIYATLYSLGTNIGHTETVKMATGLTEKQLRDSENIFFSEASLKNVNNCILEFVQSLNLPMLYVDNDRVIHTSSDGKKLVVDVDSLLANYSFKYFGKEYGINVVNFVDPKQTSFNVNILPSSDREAPYMLEGLLEATDKLWELYDQNENELDEEREHIHSSDTHGYTEAVFAALWFKGIFLQPHIAKLWEHKLVAYDRQTVKENSNNLVKPSRQIDKKLILKHWDEMLRIMCSVTLGYCPAHLVFRQLSAGKAYHPVYKAFQELGRLVRTRSTLRYLNDEELRQDTRKYLNRAELGQKFGKAIFHGREGKLHVGGQLEIKRAMLCKTIAMNCIIAWNYLALSDYYCGRTTDEERQETSEKIRSGSVMTHSHVNVRGTLFFEEDAPSSFSSTLDEMRNIVIIS